MIIQENTIEHLESVNIEIEVSSSFKVTSDAIYLSNYINGYFKNARDKKKFLEIGAGNGIISFLISKNENIEKDILLNALNLTHWNRTLAAKKLGMSFRSLRYRLKKFGLDTDDE